MLRVERLERSGQYDALDVWLAEGGTVLAKEQMGEVVKQIVDTPSIRCQADVAAGTEDDGATFMKEKDFLAMEACLGGDGMGMGMPKADFINNLGAFVRSGTAGLLEARAEYAGTNLSGHLGVEGCGTGIGMHKAGLVDCLGTFVISGTTGGLGGRG